MPPKTSMRNTQHNAQQHRTALTTRRCLGVLRHFFEKLKGWCSDHDLNSDGWNKWTKSSNLERPLMAASMQRDGFTAIEKAFPSRMRKEQSKSFDVLHPLRFDMLLNPGKCASDTCPSLGRAKKLHRHT